jgi:hypothetical protein
LLGDVSVDKYNGAKCQGNVSLSVPTTWYKAPDDYVTMYMLLSHGWDTQYMILWGSFSSYYELNKANITLKHQNSQTALGCPYQYFIRRY